MAKKEVEKKESTLETIGFITVFAIAMFILGFAIYAGMYAADLIFN